MSTYFEKSEPAQTRPIPNKKTHTRIGNDEVTSVRNNYKNDSNSKKRIKNSAIKLV